MPDEIKQLILVASIFIVIFLIVLFLVKLKSKNTKLYIKNPKNKYLNKKIRKYTKNRDFLFLTDVFLPVKDNRAIVIDNIIFGNKYIYVISQKHWEGTLKGYEYDTKWMVVSKSVTKYVDNPIIGNRFKVQTLMSFINEKEEDNVVNIVAINDKTNFSEFQSQPLENITKMNKIFKIIDEYEKSSPLNDFKEEEIERIANMVYEESKRIKHSQAR